MKLLKALMFVILITLSFNLYAQDAKPADTKTEETENPFDKPFWEETDIFIGFTPSVYLSTGAQTDSAVSPIFYPVYFGFIWPKDNYFSLQPSLRLYTSYFYMKNGEVYPAEIENRTALAFSVMFNVPVVFKMNFWDKSNLTLSAGLGFLLRFAFLASGVEESDYGDTGTAGGDLSEINKWFWGGGRFIYLSFGADWMFKITDDIQAGPDFALFIPVGPLFTNFSLNGMMISLGLKFVF